MGAVVSMAEAVALAVGAEDADRFSSRLPNFGAHVCAPFFWRKVFAAGHKAGIAHLLRGEGLPKSSDTLTDHG